MLYRAGFHSVLQTMTNVQSVITTVTVQVYVVTLWDVSCASVPLGVLDMASQDVQVCIVTESRVSLFCNSMQRQHPSLSSIISTYTSQYMFSPSLPPSLPLPSPPSRLFCPSLTPSPLLSSLSRYLIWVRLPCSCLYLCIPGPVCEYVHVQ